MVSLIGLKQFFDLFVIFLKTSTGAAFVITLCLIFQVPGMTLYVSKILMQRGDLMPGWLAVAVGIAFAVVVDFVIFFFAIKGWGKTALISAAFSAVLTTSSYKAIFLSSETGLSYWLETSPAIILGMLPAAVIAIVSHRLASEFEHTGIAEVVNSIQRDTEITLRDALKSSLERLNRTEQPGTKTIDQLLKEIE